MAMKHFNYILLISGIITFFMISCNDNFLQKDPETEITGNNFFKTVSDLQTYTNSLYSQLGYRREDIYSDNVITSSAEALQLIEGQLTADNVGGWTKGTWSNLYAINYFLVNSKNAVGDQASINNYIGIAKFFRASFYFDMIKRYGFAPWYSEPVSTGDSAMLKKTEDPRTLIVDSIMADLQYAVDNVAVGSSRTRITKYAALALMARFSLFEGTFRKYHTELNLTSTANSYLEKAVWATNELMNSGQFQITGKGSSGYAILFAGDLNSNKEAILFVDFDRALGKLNANSAEVVDWGWALDKSLVDSYLKTDGTPATNDADYATKGYVEVFKNRDPRMSATVMPPGFVMRDGTVHVPELGSGGFPQVKYYTSDPAYNNGGWTDQATDFPVFRYGETLLINAEAKAELGTITQTDLDATINKLRDRVDMPHMMMNVAIDPILESKYPSISGDFKNVLLEIRRERRVELACEGLRYDDILRWKAGDLLNTRSQGPYFSGAGTYDMTGDGVPDIAILATPPTDAEIAALKKLGVTTTYSLTLADGSAAAYRLSEGTKGILLFTNDDKYPRNFESPKDYYFPIPWDQIRDNPNLKQPTGW